jgi:UDP-N-acetylmuramate--alanine ligase
MKQNIYFVGAGGIGMAALVRYFLSRNLNVAGYDRTRTHLTDAIIAEGAKISYDDSMEAVPAEFRDPATTTVIYTPAIPHDNVPLTFFRDGGFELMKRSEALGMITRSSKAICFSGTHGKTTTSSMAAHIMHTAKIGCNAFLGGILRNYNSNLLLSETYHLI